MKFNSTSFSKIYYGDKPITKVYVGSDVVFGGTYVFDGSSTSYFTTDYTLSGLSNFTFMVEVKIDSDKSNQGFLTDDISGARLRFYTDSAGTIRGQAKDNDLSSSIIKGYTSDFTMHQYAYTWDGTTNKLYIDGVSVDTETSVTDFAGYSVSSPNLIIGRGVLLSGDYLDGEMNIVQIYSTDLDATDLLSLVSDPGGISSNKVIDFRDNKTATTWTDEVSGKIATNAGAVTLK